MLLGRICYADEGIFQNACGLFRDLGLPGLLVGRTGEEAASHLMALQQPSLQKISGILAPREEHSLV